MPGDPKECRQQALACVRLAQTYFIGEDFNCGKARGP